MRACMSCMYAMYVCMYDVCMLCMCVRHACTMYVVCWWPFRSTCLDLLHVSETRVPLLHVANDVTICTEIAFNVSAGVKIVIVFFKPCFSTQWWLITSKSLADSSIGNEGARGPKSAERVKNNRNG